MGEPLAFAPSYSFLASIADVVDLKVMYAKPVERPDLSYWFGKERVGMEWKEEKKQKR